jgi:lysophospholipase L1-like esterase
LFLLQQSLGRNRLLFVLIGCLVQPAVSLGAEIVLIGDSITEGRVAGEGASFADQLQALRPDDQIGNAGCAGSTTGDWIRPVTDPPSCMFGGAYVLNAKPHMPADLAFIMLGANDAMGFFETNPIEPPEYRENLERLIRRLSSDTARIVLVTPTLNPGAREEVRKRLERYRSVVLELCNSLDRVLCGPDIQKTVSGPSEGLAGLHPSEEGHRRIAQQFDDFLTELMPTSSTPQ